jgi:hypothetical protein|tara:strand:+ start:163 stop:1668 length:1506 start_codon:yes stop_codon:yes gene_type:complete
MTIERFKNIFTGLERAHGVTKIGESNGNGTKVKGQSFVKREPVTDELWNLHLQGKESLGIIPINDDNQCIWGCIDIDSYAGFDHKKLISKIKNLNLPLVVCRSKSGGAHVFLFTSEYATAKLMRDKLVQIRAVLGYGNSEVFPKQTELKSQDDTGNFLNLPYFNGDSSVRYAFKEDGEAATLDDFYLLYESKKINNQELETLHIKRPETKYSDGPPCIELMSENKIGEGGRNNALFHYGVYAKQKWPDGWKSKLIVFNESAMEKPLSDSEVDIVVKQHDKKDWGYKCNDQPMCSLCDKTLCRSRKFGIGQEVLFPNLTDLQVIDLEDPYYYLNVDGERLKLESVKHLRQQSLFQEACMVQLKNRPPTLKEKDWVHITNILLNNAEVTEPAEGLRTEDQLKNHLEEFCLNRLSSTDRTDLPKGGVWNNNGYHHFVFDRFYHQFLMRRRWDLGYSRTAQLLKEKCDCEDKRVGKERLSVFRVKEFDKKQEEYKQKMLKEEAPY